MEKPIHINYATLDQIAQEQQITDQLVRRAQRLFGWRARRQLLQLLDAHLRVLAVETAAHEVNPYALYQTGRRAVFEALELYRVGNQKESFRAFADPFIRQAMQRCKEHMSATAG